jgi:ParB-like chromosome segregation protein Spo0J
MAKSKDSPAYKVERWALARLHPHPQNPRTHSDAQIEMIAAAIRERGWTRAVLIDESGMILAGHGAVLAARKLGMTEAPVVIARGWSEPQKIAALIGDNRIAEGSRWDDELLGLGVSAVSEAGIELALIGMSDADLKRLGGEDAASLPINEIETGGIDDEFWIAVRGPLRHQADALLKLQTAMKDMDGVQVELGTVAVG